MRLCRLTEPLTGSIRPIYSLNESGLYPPNMRPVAPNTSRVISEVRLCLLALTVAIPGLVLAPLGRVG